MAILQITPSVVIDETELDERFVRASGPGGQNVNKVATAVELRFDAATSRALDSGMRQRLRDIAGSRMTAEGIVLIDARRHRTQAKNREDARARLIELLREAATPPRRRRATRPSLASKDRRVETKRRRSEKKGSRGRVAGED